jgi:YHS domain-containing protein
LVDPVNKNRQGAALKGYDPVAYFRASAAVKGSPQFTYSWSGANWQFSSGDNRDEFIRQPEKYAPQFGGYCAWAVSNNYTADADPEAWRIIDRKLYVIKLEGVSSHYFDASVAEFDHLVASARLNTKAAR